ncbi:MAG: hypothetical protein J6V98_04545 [Bacteroidales bacterium]|nr:hypothetical protein [Bacteroidales bacterium]
MKKNIFAIAAAAILAIGMTACEPETIVPGENNAPQTSNARVKSTADLHNTSWSYTVTYTEFLNNLLGTNLPCMDSINDETYEFGLEFDGTYAHFSFPDNIMAFAGEGEMQQIFGVSYEYTYNGATHTGYLDGVADDENDNPGQLEFTYDDATDVITFNLNLFYAEDETPVTLTLNFARNE